MRKRTREYVLLAITVVVGVIFGRLSLEWGLLELYGGMAAILLVMICVGMPWVELAPDGAWRREPEA
jgi:F0F1-type ATP synthase assembly protein I